MADITRNGAVGFQIGETVYLKTDPDQIPYIVLCIIQTPIGITYEVTNNGEHSIHYGIELTRDVDILAKLK